MEITKVDLVINENILKPSKVKAYGTITLDDQLNIRIRVIEGSKGLIIGFPYTQNSKRGRMSEAYPITKEFSKKIETAILEKYNSINK